MKKILLSFLLALCAPFSFGQSYPSPTYKNLTVTTTFTATGLVTYADLVTQAANTVIGNATASTGAPSALPVPSCSTSSSALTWTSASGFGCNTAITASSLNGTATFTANPTYGTMTYFPTVPNNTVLQGISTLSTSTVIRLGNTTAGDAPPLVFLASGSACPLNSGNGDGGSQVKSANGLCWLGVYGSAAVDARQFGLDLTGATDDTTNLQNAWNFAASIGQNLKLPGTISSGYIKFSTLTMPVPTGYFSGSSSIIGDQGNTTIKSTVTGTTCAISVTAAASSPNFGGQDWGGWALWSLNNAGYGLCLNGVSHFTANPLAILNFTYQIFAVDTISTTFNRPELLNGQRALYATIGTVSYPNEWNLNQPYISGQTADGILLFSPADFNIRGGDLEAINVANASGFCSVNVSGNPVNGTKGLSIFGGYYQDNGGNGDVCITQNATGAGSGPGVHSINGVEFGRISSTTFVTHEIVLANGNSAAQTVVSMHGNSFNNFNSYVVSAARSFWLVSTPATANYKLVGWGDNRFGNATEAPGDCFAASASNCINLPDGHIEQWGTATTSSATPGLIAVTWPMACPTAIDDLLVTSSNGSAVTATGYGLPTTTGATLYSAVGPAGVAWRVLCH